MMVIESARHRGHSRLRYRGLAILLLAGTAACGELIEPTDRERSTPITVVTAPALQLAPVPRANTPLPETESTIVETSLAATDLIYDAEGEVTSRKRAADPYRTSDSILAGTAMDWHDRAASIGAGTDTESL